MIRQEQHYVDTSVVTSSSEALSGPRSAHEQGHAHATQHDAGMPEMSSATSEAF